MFTYCIYEIIYCRIHVLEKCYMCEQTAQMQQYPNTGWAKLQMYHTSNHLTLASGRKRKLTIKPVASTLSKPAAPTLQHPAPTLQERSLFSDA